MQKMKKEYMKPDFELAVYETEDVITLSSGGDIGPDDNIVEPWLMICIRS